MRHEDTEFVGGPLDGRVLAVLAGMTGQPPRVYTVPVPAPEGGPPVVHIYHREPSPGPRGARRTRWVFVYDPEGERPQGLKWPWSKATGGKGPGSGASASGAPGSGAPGSDEPGSKGA